MQAEQAQNKDTSPTDPSYEPYGQFTRSLSGHIRHASEVLEEHDIEVPDQSTIIRIVTVALDARALLAGVSIRFPSADRLRSLLEILVLFCAEPYAQAEGAL
jgi:hypothetical protein